VTRNLAHSCGRWTLAHHFRGRPRARALYLAFLEAVREVAPVRVQVSKTRIAFMTRMRFAGVTPRRDHVRASLLLSRQARHKALARVEAFGPTYFGHTFEIREVSDVDRAVAFYRDQLGFDLVEQMGGPERVLVLDRDGKQLGLVPLPEANAVYQVLAEPGRDALLVEADPLRTPALVQVMRFFDAAAARSR